MFTGVVSIAACCDLCRPKPGCSSFTFAWDGPQHTSGTCWLKHASGFTPGIHADYHSSIMVRDNQGALGLMLPKPWMLACCAGMGWENSKTMHNLAALHCVTTTISLLFLMLHTVQLLPVGEDCASTCSQAGLQPIAFTDDARETELCALVDGPQTLYGSTLLNGGCQLTTGDLSTIQYNEGFYCGCKSSETVLGWKASADCISGSGDITAGPEAICRFHRYQDFLALNGWSIGWIAGDTCYAMGFGPNDAIINSVTGIGNADYDMQVLCPGTPCVGVCSAAKRHVHKA